MKLITQHEIRVQNYDLKSFKNDKGETIEYAQALIIDEEGKVLPVKADKELKFLEVDTPVEAKCEFNIFQGIARTKDGGEKQYLKLKLTKVEGYEK